MPPRPKKILDPMAAEDTTQTTTTEETNVSVESTTNPETGELEWSVTIKFGGGYDAPWLVGRFSNLDALTETVTDREDDLRDVMVKLGKLATFAASQAPAGTVTTATPSNSGGGSGGNRPDPHVGPNGETRDCQHGKMYYRSKVEGGEVKWRGFFCPRPKNSPDQCKPQWLND